MKIVVLDGYTMNPGDLSWQPLQELGDCVIHKRTRPNETLERARNAGILITNKVVLEGQTIQRLPELKYIGVTATGYNVVDIEAARKRGVVVTNVPAYSTESVAQMTFALLLELTHHVGEHSRRVRDGGWTNCPDFSFQDFPLVELDGLTMGIIGFGATGRSVARLAGAFGLKVFVHTRNVPDQPPKGIQFTDLDTLFSKSDIVSLHCPLTDQTRHLVNAGRLERMKSSAFLINTSRGPVVDEAALAHALNQDQLAGAAMDVLPVEPPPADNPLLAAKNCIITPHHAWATAAARKRLLQVTVENLRAFLAGKPRNVIG